MFLLLIEQPPLLLFFYIFPLPFRFAAAAAALAGGDSGGWLRACGAGSAASLSISRDSCRASFPLSPLDREPLLMSTARRPLLIKGNFSGS